MSELTIVQAAEIIGITAGAVRQRIEAGQMEARKVNPRLWLISAEEVERQRVIGRKPAGRKRKERPPKRPVGRPRKVQQT